MQVSRVIEQMKHFSSIRISQATDEGLTIYGIINTDTGFPKDSRLKRNQFLQNKVAKVFDGFTIYVYSPEMICLEKLRAICQQMPEYLIAIKGNARGNTPRAKDFYDIYLIIHKLDVDLFNETNIKMCKMIFAIKEVSLHLISNVKNTKDFHKQNFRSLEDSVFDSDKLKAFDFYFDYVVKFCDKLTSLLDKKVST